ncbi:9513_t:CDS:2 [Ambispora leptoticha]|uniref:9513_t:CDS:1 n=1 Tax=Ambispora leptoticha TaxID=144679 RepID=A0A9N9GWU5_9GLOM|nr:9513_t:CDS:2 [Ambispora leptoticha]
MTVPRNFMKIMKENTNIQITKIKQKIQQLINQTTAENEAQKKLLNYLFRKLDELKEIETMERLKEYAGERIRAGEAEFICGIGSGDILLIGDGQREATMSLNLQTSKIEPDPVKELLEKHGWEDKENNNEF